MRLIRIDHIAITVKSVKATVEFYTQMLNMQELAIVYKEKEMKAVRFGDQRIHIHKVRNEQTPKAIYAASGSTDICLVTDLLIADLVNRFERYNIHIEKEPMAITGTLG